jgi:serine/threonine-protein kinase
MNSRQPQDPSHPSGSRTLEKVIDGFEDAWLRGQRPAIDLFLPGEAERRHAVLLELVHADLEFRLKTGEAVRAESYLERYPELWTDPEAVLGLFVAEYSLRQREDPDLAIEEYQQRLPRYAHEMRDRLERLDQYLKVDSTQTVRIRPRVVAGEAGDEAVAPPPARYRPMRLHARGGLGEVLLAEDAELGRAVALKRLQPRHGADPDSRRRFLREAEITARLGHPGIVPIYGLTHDADGQPCYAMRFIQGESLQEAIERFHRGALPPAEAALGLRQLLGRFVSVCQTMAYAHSNGVIHRDLKPQNIMLGEYGETLVVDWGLAREITACGLRLAASSDPEAASGTTPDGSNPQAAVRNPQSEQTLTRDGEVMGTPAYMAPEQAAGDRDGIGPASDIYSLGATLYTLLTGRPPFPGGDVLACVQQGVFAPPRQLRKGLPRALEAVCLKAMALRPEARYLGAAALVQDVERWLADEPVRARRESWPERGRRWLKRHRTLVTVAAAAAIVALVTVSTAALRLKAARDNEETARVQAEQAHAREHSARLAERKAAEKAVRERQAADRHRTRAETSYRLAREALAKCAQLQKDPRLQQGPLEDIRRSLQAAQAEFFQKFLQLRGDDEAFQAERAAVLGQLALLTAHLGNKEEVVRHFQEVATAGERLLRAHPSNQRYRFALAATYQNLGQAFSDLGRREDALRCFDTALRHFGALPGDSLPARRGRAATHNNRGLLLYGNNALTEALPSFEEARRLQEALVRDHPDAASHRQDLATTLNNLGNLHNGAGRFDEARTAFERARDLQRRLAEDYPEKAPFRHELARTLYNLAHLESLQGRVAVARALTEEGLGLAEEVMREHPQVPLYQAMVARLCRQLGVLLSNQDRNADAVRLLERARSLERARLAGSPGEAEARSELAAIAIALAELHAGRGQLSEAIRNLEEGCSALQPLLGKNSRHHSTFYLARAQTHLASLYGRTGRTEVSERSFQEAGRLWKRLADAYPDDRSHRAGLARWHRLRAAALAVSGRAGEARSEYARARELFQALAKVEPRVPAHRCELTMTCQALGELRQGTDPAAEVMPLFEEARALAQGLVREDPGSLDYAYFQGNACLALGNLQLGRGQVEQAVKTFREAVGVLEPLAKRPEATRHYHRLLAAAHFNVALHSQRRGAIVSAAESYEKAYGLFARLAEGAPGEPIFSAALLKTSINLGQVLSDLGRKDEARKVYERGRAIGEPLVKAHPAVAQYRAYLGAVNLALGNLILSGKEPAASLEHIDRGLGLLGEIVRKGGTGEARMFLCQGHALRADALGRLGRVAEGEAEWARALKLAGKPTPNWLRVLRAVGLARTGKYTAATAEVAEVARDPDLPASACYNLARVYAQVAAVAAKDKGMAAEERAHQAERYGVEAVGMLRRLVERGFHDAGQLRNDGDFDPLRSRADFRLLIDELARLRRT